MHRVVAIVGGVVANAARAASGVVEAWSNAGAGDRAPGVVARVLPAIASVCRPPLRPQDRDGASGMGGGRRGSRAPVGNRLLWRGGDRRLP